jgi:allantoinase
VLNYSWREYGNRVGAWRCLDLFDELALPAAALVNTALYDHCPELVAACVARGDELVGHGHSNAERQGGWTRPPSARCCSTARRMRSAQRPGAAGLAVAVDLESPLTPDLLAETGYTLHAELVPRRPAGADAHAQRRSTLWAVPYPQELNDIPMIVARQMDAKDFAQMIIDQFDEMLEQTQARTQPLVMGIALHPYLVGQPYRLRHLRRALAHIAAERDRGGVWVGTPGAIQLRMSGGRWPRPWRRWSGAGRACA